MTDRLADKLLIQKIYENSGVGYFNDDVRFILEEIIKELYYSNQALMFKLRLNHIDRAVFKYREAKRKKYIYNTKQYFKACIVSAIRETGLDDLELID